MNHKVVTICGSMKFAKQMMEISGDLELQKGYVVIQCIYFDKKITEKDKIDMLAEIHRKKIDISDAIYIVNIDGYIGESASNEIKYAIENGKEVIYHEKCRRLRIEILKWGQALF